MNSTLSCDPFWKKSSDSQEMILANSSSQRWLFQLLRRHLSWPWMQFDNVRVPRWSLQNHIHISVRVSPQMHRWQTCKGFGVGPKFQIHLSGRVRVLSLESQKVLPSSTGKILYMVSFGVAYPDPFSVNADCWASFAKWKTNSFLARKGSTSWQEKASFQWQ